MTITINNSIASSARRRSLLRRVRFGCALVLSSLGVVLGVPSVSSAYVDTSTSGRIGPVTAPASSVRPGMTFYVPGVTVARNGAAAAGQAQGVVVTYYLQRYNGRSWTLADQIGQAGTIQQHGNAVTVPPITLMPRYIAGTVGYNPDPHAHPGLHVIAIVEAVKGTLAVVAASGLEIIGPAPLQRWVHELIQRFQLDTQHGAMAWLANAINPNSVHFAAAAVFAYAIVHLIEAWGLWRAKAWASLLGCLAAAIYLPFDLYALVRHPGWISAAVVAINLLVVWVLARDLIKRRH